MSVSIVVSAILARKCLAFVAPVATSPRLLRTTAGVQGASLANDVVTKIIDKTKVAAKSPPSDPQSISYNEIRQALRDWCDGIIEIGKVYTEGGDFRAKAMEVIEANYAFSHVQGPNSLLFKPTLAREHNFRSQFDEFLSYFVGDGKYSEDMGFAIKPWTKIRYDMHGTYITDTTATVSGLYWFTDKATDTETKVEYTFQFIRVDKPANKLKIVLHHSSLPFSP